MKQEPQWTTNKQQAIKKLINEMISVKWQLENSHDIQLNWDVILENEATKISGIYGNYGKKGWMVTECPNAQ